MMYVTCQTVTTHPATPDDTCYNEYMRLDSVIRMPSQYLTCSIGT